MRAHTKRVALLPLAIGIVAAVLAGCSGDGDAGMNSAAEVQAGTAADMPQADTDRSAGVPYGGAKEAREERPAPPAPTGKLLTQDRKLARSASLALRTRDVEGTVGRVRDIAAAAGGFTGSERAGEKEAVLTVSVPSDKLDSVLSGLSKVGEVIRRDVTVEDVTEQVADVDSRVRSQRASVSRVRALLARAKTIGEIVSIEGELTSRETELEALLARQKSLEGLVALSTVRVEISERGVVEEDDDSAGFLGGLSGGWQAFLTVGSAVLTAVGAMLPFLIGLGVPIALIVWLVRRRMRARSPRPAAAAGTPEG